MSAEAGVTWTRCTACAELVYLPRQERGGNVCPECGHHSRLTAPERIDLLADAGSFRPLSVSARPRDALGFVDSRSYAERLDAARSETELDEAVLCGTATIHGAPCALAVMDFRFMGGSLSTAVGEMIAHCGEVALDRRMPLVIVSASGGARMQEGCLSLMQMAKTSQTLGRLRRAGLLSVAVVTDPTYGGVAASFVTNCDILLAEPGARMGFAGPRVIRDTIRTELPAGFQTAEYLLAHGQVDMVVDRAELRSTLGRVLDAARRPLTAVESEPQDALLVRDRERLTERDAWEIVSEARHIDRPTALDYIDHVFDSFVELRGDRLFGDCPAIVAGLARLQGRWLAVVGHQKGHSTSELVGRNFGMPRPEGYRKAQRVMRLAARLRLPIVTLVDTPGAFPGIDAEERGQAAAIAESVLEMSELPTPLVAVITGEGGSGGALALAVGDRVLAMERTTYSVISPEGCSAILWRGAEEAPEAARALRLTAPDLLDLGVLDGVVPEPDGGSYGDPFTATNYLRSAIIEALSELFAAPDGVLPQRRRERFHRFGAGTRNGVGHTADPSLAGARPSGARGDQAMATAGRSAGGAAS